MAVALEMLVPPGQGEQLSGPRSDQSTGSVHTQQGLRSVPGRFDIRFRICMADF